MTLRTVNAIGVRSLATIMGVMGLLWGLIVAITWVAAGVLGAPVPGLPELLVTVLGATLYGVVGGAITALVYNVAASLVGGIRLTLS